jgi:hypothetical protein
MTSRLNWLLTYMLPHVGSEPIAEQVTSMPSDFWAVVAAPEPAHAMAVALWRQGAGMGSDARGGRPHCRTVGLGCVRTAAPLGCVLAPRRCTTAPGGHPGCGCRTGARSLQARKVTRRAKGIGLGLRRLEKVPRRRPQWGGSSCRPWRRGGRTSAAPWSLAPCRLTCWDWRRKKRRRRRRVGGERRGR